MSAGQQHGTDVTLVPWLFHIIFPPSFATYFGVTTLPLSSYFKPVLLSATVPYGKKYNVLIKAVL
jgi:hypothetical protein